MTRNIRPFTIGLYPRPGLTLGRNTWDRPMVLRNHLAFHHRKTGLNRFYANMMSFEQGDDFFIPHFFRLFKKNPPWMSA